MFDNNKISEIIRVNHAGERGAKVIYEGQMLALKLKKLSGDDKTLELIAEMKEQEIKHFEYFDAEVKKLRVRPTVMQPLWEVGGFALGFITAMIDKKSAMVCTTAVEEVIDEHYQQQINELEDFFKHNQNPAKEFNNKEAQNDYDIKMQNLKILQQNIIKFREEEIHHRDIAYDNKAKEFVAYKPLSSLIKLTTKMAIAISKKI